MTQKPKGQSLYLRCDYHAWTYDTLGRLKSAPEFENRPGFNKAENGLFEIRTIVRCDGIWVNLEKVGVRERNEESPRIAVGEGLEPRDDVLPETYVAELPFTQYSSALDGAVVVESWQVRLKCNWKLLGKFSRPASISRYYV